MAAATIFKLFDTNSRPQHLIAELTQRLKG